MFERIRKLFRSRCRGCGERALLARNRLLATCVDERGKRYPDSWTYYECAACGDRSKHYLDGRIEDPSDAEWLQHCEEARAER